MGDYSHKNAANVLQEVEALISEAEFEKKYFKFEDVCSKLSIFDWWPKHLTLSHLKLMRTFLKEAIKLGYEGYVCFKVGAAGCANGMWAAVEESEDGYSPRGCATLYRSFTPSYTYWDVSDRDGHFDWLEGKEYDSLKTIRALEAFIKEHPQEVYSKQNDERIEKEVDLIEKVLGL